MFFLQEIAWKVPSPPHPKTSLKLKQNHSFCKSILSFTKTNWEEFRKCCVLALHLGLWQTTSHCPSGCNTAGERSENAAQRCSFEPAWHPCRVQAPALLLISCTLLPHMDFTFFRCWYHYLKPSSPNLSYLLPLSYSNCTALGFTEGCANVC